MVLTAEQERDMIEGFNAAGAALKDESLKPEDVKMPEGMKTEEQLREEEAKERRRIQREEEAKAKAARDKVEEREPWWSRAELMVGRSRAGRRARRRSGETVRDREHVREITDDDGNVLFPKPPPSIHVTQLPYKTNENDLRTYFEKLCGGLGSVVSCRLVKKGGSFKGVAFLDLRDDNAFSEALKSHRASFGGRKINVRRTLDSDDLKNAVERSERAREQRGEVINGRKRASGVCFAFQEGRCTRGEACRFKHNAVDASVVDAKLDSVTSKKRAGGGRKQPLKPNWGAKRIKQKRARG